MRKEGVFSVDDLVSVHRPKAPFPISIGDKVFLNSGGIAMEVIDIRGDSAVCQIKENDTHMFPIMCLTPAEYGTEKDGFFSRILH